ncbi:acetyl-CoA C-acetyltransferase [Domibacillus aminovorans]|uniref:acetyl-CoA C-acetyltransferase n=1 Tax=Domibacillus aminovorans TaxID=29332 RepID=A0A177L934_9BACI|nr:acetyl-CoA C-acetyltransferase [Domibacillus aminovorans]OAH61151.1 acetyl-CoA acetyltransferase [Domibacillus aminovorans]
MVKTVMVEGARTPIGKFGGALSTLTASQLGGMAMKEAMKRAGVKPEELDEIIFGNVLQAGQGQIPSRQAAREAGIPWDIKTETVNKVCASGLRSVTMADQIIRAGDEEVILAGGMESMSNVPYAVFKARWGTRMGDMPMVDLMIYDGLSCSFTGVHMGTYGDKAAEEFGLTREEQDKWAIRSHERAVAAIESGTMAEEIVAVAVPQRKGHSVVVDTDESPRKEITKDVLEKLRPAFGNNGTITAGNAPGINDGAAALVLMSDERAEKEGKNVLATVIGHAEIAVEAEKFPQTPGLVINELLKKTGKSVDDIELFEINEAFAAVVLASNKIAGIDPEKVNVNGGAVAFGHPIGASGARIILTLAYELRRRGGGIGIAAICSGSGQGDAIMIEVKK